MIKVVVGGATGKLGSLVCSLVQEQEDMRLFGAVVSPNSKNLGKEVAPGIRATDRLISAVEGADVYVDVTTPQAATETLSKVGRKGLCLVVGTTGLTKGTLGDLEISLLDNGASAVVTPNFSVGVNVFWKTCHDLAEQLTGYDVEIIEMHHNQKKDAPSGTAKKAAEIDLQCHQSGQDNLWKGGGGRREGERDRHPFRPWGGRGGGSYCGVRRKRREDRAHTSSTLSGDLRRRLCYGHQMGGGKERW